MSRILLLVWCFSGMLNSGISQYAPAAGQPGTTAVHKDSSVIVRWANSVEVFQRGAADIANGWTSLAAFGDSTEALGYAQGISTSVVSLGDSGSITLGFPFPVMNGPGADFAVFENSFSDDYLEFAFVEVSSDGINFVRFPAVSLTPVAVQTGPFGYTNTELVHNLAGKYRQGYGTPFDLDDLADSTGINPDSILFVRVLDVIGSISSPYSTFDSQGNRINDPYPTDFDAGGFDLDGVGVINENNIYASIETNQGDAVALFTVYPNPSSGQIQIRVTAEQFDLKIFDSAGRLVYFTNTAEPGFFDLPAELDAGLYFVCVNDSIPQRLVITE
ncbi:MAG: T9SS type A sorting domain-containing protein [Bacteroidetes bacterium]|nr:T9SS type A sorting domain-containing protein [Bacteroidota bacterium]